MSTMVLIFAGYTRVFVPPAKMCTMQIDWLAFKKLISNRVVCLWRLVVQSLDRCHWRLLFGRQIVFAWSAVSVMISLPLSSLSLSLSQSIYQDLHLSLAFSQSLSLSLSLSLSHTHTFCAYTLRFTLRHISASAWLRSHSVLFCFFADASWHNTNFSVDGRATEKETVSYNLCYLQCWQTQLNATNFDSEEQGKEASKLYD